MILSSDKMTLGQVISGQVKSCHLLNFGSFANPSFNEIKRTRTVDFNSIDLSKCLCTDSVQTPEVKNRINL